MSLAGSALSPRAITLSISQRPQDRSFAFYVQFYDARKRGTQAMWTDSQAHAVQFAANHRCFARVAVVKDRDDWARGRGLAFVEKAVT